MYYTIVDRGCGRSEEEVRNEVAGKRKSEWGPRARDKTSRPIHPLSLSSLR